MASRKSQSAGLLLFRRSAAVLEVLLGHPGGPFWQNKDDGAWSIPKGLIGADEAALSAARREFVEETRPDTILMEISFRSARHGRQAARSCRLGPLNATGIRSHPQQYLRNGMAAALRTPSGLSGNRPCGLIRYR
jgi:NUDIX domain